MRKLSKIIAVISFLNLAYASSAEECSLLAHAVTTEIVGTSIEPVGSTSYIASVPEVFSSFSTSSTSTAQPLASEPTTQAKDGSSGACGTVGGHCLGDITYYDAGLGACGWTNNGYTEDVFALAHGMTTSIHRSCFALTRDRHDGRAVQR